MNTKPLLYGITRSPIITDIDLTIDYPSRIAAMLLHDEIDMGLVPVAIIPEMKEYQPSGTGRSPLANVPEFVNTISGFHGLISFTSSTQLRRPDFVDQISA